MCKILVLPKNIQLPFDKFSNAVHNNPHGYGILLKDRGKIECIKECPEGGNDPEKIYKILEDAKDIERFVHLRWRTVGDISLENTQPFPILSTNKRNLYFMHNGTIGFSGSSSYYRNGVQVHQTVDKEEESDTKKFAGQLTEIFARLAGENGKGDIEDIWVQKILDKFWNSSDGRAILVSSDQESYFFNKVGWRNIKVDGQDVGILASNDTYFDSITRGPLYEARKREEDAKRRENEAEEKARKKEEVSGRNIVPLLCPGFSSRYSVSELLSDILEDWDIYNPEGYVTLANLSVQECEELFGKLGNNNGSWLFLQLTKFLKEETERRAILEDKVIELAEKLRNYENEDSGSDPSLSEIEQAKAA